MPKKSICIIDPFKNILEVYRIILEEKGYEVDTALTLEESLHCCALKSYSIIITEYFFPLEKMRHFIRSIKKVTPETYLIMNTSVTIDDPTYKALFDMGLDDLLVKPYEQEKLLAHIEKGVIRQEILIEKQKREKGVYSDPVAQGDPRGVFSPVYFNKLIRQEIKKAKRHNQPVSFVLLRLPSKDIMGNGFESFYLELINLLRKSLREEDIMGRENGNLSIILEKTDEAGSQKLGRRLEALIQAHPSFQSKPSLQAVLNGLAFQYYTFPHPETIPEFLRPLLKEIETEFPS
jgi:PleD family two-component response regulator